MAKSEDGGWIDRGGAWIGPGQEKVRTPLEYLENCFADEEWSRGCYMTHFPPGVLTTFGSVLRDPVARVHWAGTETATRSNGFIDGAVRSGERAAQEVLAA